MLKSFGLKGKVTFPKVGTVISMVGDDIAGVTGYVETSATPNVKCYT